MPVWDWLGLASNALAWGVFVYLLTRRRWNAAALAVGVLHMLFAFVVSVAPFRAFLDPDYAGLGLGFLRFEKAAASVPAALIFCWAVAAGCAAVAGRRGRWLKLVLVGDLFWALNFGGSTLLARQADAWRIDFGDERSINGLAGAFIILLLLAVPFAASAFWALGRGRSDGSAPPVASEPEGRGGGSGDAKGGGDLRLCASEV